MYTIPCGHKIGPVDNTCGLNGLCPTCQVVRELRAACEHGRLCLESVITDEMTKEANLWQGEMLPKAVALLEKALSRVQEVTLP